MEYIGQSKLLQLLNCTTTRLFGKYLVTYIDGIFNKTEFQSCWTSVYSSRNYKTVEVLTEDVEGGDDGGVDEQKTNN